MLIRVLPPVPASVTRRRVLLAAAGGPLVFSIGACTDDPPVEPPADPDREALEAAREVEMTALASIEEWWPDVAESSITAPNASAVVGAHVIALDDALSATPTPAVQPQTPSPSPSPSLSMELVPAPSTAQVVALLDDAARQHTRALRTASPEISPLLASIAASDAALAAAIRRSS
jgi:hypothetical protein